MAFRFQLRRDTAALWSAVNPVLLIGELAYETDTNKLKIGDGTNNWNDLPYFLDTVDSVNGKVGVVVLNTDDIAEPGATAFNKWFTTERVADTLIGGENIQISYSSLTEKVTIASPGNIKFPEGIGLTAGQPLPIIDEYGTTGSFYIGLTSAASLGHFGIGTTGPIAALEINSTTSGILLPRMTRDERDAIGATAGLVIYQTDFTEGAYQYKTTGWEPIDPGDISGTAGRLARFTDNSVIGNASVYDDGSSVWIGPTGDTASSIFSVTSTTKGIQIPTMTNVQKEAIVSPVDGLIVTETGTTGGINQYINGVGWVQYLHDNAGVTGGTQYIYGDLVVSGTLSAAAKSFRIDNPEKPEEKLVYGVAEGPEHSVFFRGRSRNNKIELPEEWKWLVDGRSITVQITPIGKWSRLVVDRIEDNVVYVKHDGYFKWFRPREKFHFFYLVQGERKDIPSIR